MLSQKKGLPVDGPHGHTLQPVVDDIEGVLAGLLQGHVGEVMFHAVVNLCGRATDGKAKEDLKKLPLDSRNLL